MELEKKETNKQINKTKTNWPIYSNQIFHCSDEKVLYLHNFTLNETSYEKKKTHTHTHTYIYIYIHTYPFV